MIDVTEKFMQKIYESGRTPLSRVLLEIDTDYQEPLSLDYSSIDKNLDPDTVLEQIHNKTFEENARYATFENEGMALDGSELMISKNNNFEFGWWSENLSNDEENMNEFLSTNIDGPVHYDLKNLTVIFSRVRNEYAIDFDVEYYNDFFGISETLLGQVSISENTDIIKVIETPETIDLSLLNKVKVIINKWSEPFTKAKIIELYFGRFMEFKENLYTVSIDKELDLLADSTPSDEATFSVNNIGLEYNILNPKGDYKYLNEGNRVTIFMGLEIDENVEWHQVGQYYLQKPNTPDSLTAEFVANDVLQNLNNDIIWHTVEQRRTFYEWASLIFERHDYPVSIPTNIGNMRMSGLVPDLAKRDAIRQILQATGSTFINRYNGNMEAVQLLELWDREPVDTVQLTAPLKIEKNKDYKEIETFFHSYVKEALKAEQLNTTTIYRGSVIIDKWNIPSNYVIGQEYLVKYNSSPAGSAYDDGSWFNWFSDSSGNKIEGITVRDYVSLEDIYTGYMIIKFKRTIPAGAVSFSVEGRKINDNSTRYSRNIEDNATDILSIDSLMVDSQELVNKILDTLDLYRRMQFKYTITCLQNFALEPGDKILIPTQYSDDEGNQIIKEAIITKIPGISPGSIDYTIEARGT